MTHDEVEITSRAELRAWLSEHHRQAESIWLVTYKKAAGPELHVPWEDVVREALCFGWIDSQARAIDDERTSVRLSPRKPGSMWSAVNKAHVERLAAEGLITDAGWAAIDAAKADGSWTLLDDVEEGIVPDDLGTALDGRHGAREAFEAFPPSTKRAILAWIKLAKRDDTRAARIDETADKAARGERAR